MKRINKILASVTAVVVTGISGVGIAAAVTPALPAEQQALVTAGYVKVADWGKFQKKQGACTVTVIKSDSNYYVSSKGGLNSTLYPVRPANVVNGANFLLTNCLG